MRRLYWILVPLALMLALAAALEKPSVMAGSPSGKKPQRYELIITAKDIKDAAEYVVFKYPHKLRKQKNDLKYRLLQHLLASQTSLLVQQVDDDGKVYSYLPSQEVYNEETGEILEPDSTKSMSHSTVSNYQKQESDILLPQVESGAVILANDKFVPKRARQTVKFPRHSFVAQKNKRPRKPKQQEHVEYADYDQGARTPYRRNSES